MSFVQTHGAKGTKRVSDGVDGAPCKRQAESEVAVTIDLVSSDDDSDDWVAYGNGHDDDVIVIDGASRFSPTGSSSSSSSNLLTSSTAGANAPTVEDEDIVITSEGCNALSDFPHARENW